MTTVLVLDEDRLLLSLLDTLLSEEGFQTVLVTQVEEALNMLEAPGLAALIISAEMHQPEGAAICRMIREMVDLPIIVISKDHSPEEELVAFAAGADDFLAQPFEPRVLLTRLAHAISHHPHMAGDTALVDGAQLSFKNLRIDPETRTAFVDDADLHLTRTEFDILTLLMAKPHRVFTRQRILDQVWRDGWQGSEHLLDSHTSRLRRKIRDLGGPSVISAVRGIGYRLTSEATLTEQ